MEWISHIITWIKANIIDLMIYIATHETGILIGLGLLIFASGYLPKKVRIHILTAGISIAIYQIGKNYYFRQQWKEAEQERDRLKKEKSELEAQGQEILQELEQLKVRSKALNQEISALKTERQRLEDTDDFNPNEFDTRIKALENESKEVDQLINDLPVIGKAIGEATHRLHAATQ